MMKGKFTKVTYILRTGFELQRLCAGIEIALGVDAPRDQSLMVSTPRRANALFANGERSAFQETDRFFFLTLPGRNG